MIAFGSCLASIAFIHKDLARVWKPSTFRSGRKHDAAYLCAVKYVRINTDTLTFNLGWDSQQLDAVVKRCLIEMIRLVFLNTLLLASVSKDFVASDSNNIRSCSPNDCVTSQLEGVVGIGIPLWTAN